MLYTSSWAESELTTSVAIGSRKSKYQLPYDHGHVDPIKRYIVVLTSQYIIIYSTFISRSTKQTNGIFSYTS